MACLGLLASIALRSLRRLRFFRADGVTLAALATSVLLLLSLIFVIFHGGFNCNFGLLAGFDEFHQPAAKLHLQLIPLMIALELMEKLAILTQSLQLHQEEFLVANGLLILLLA